MTEPLQTNAEKRASRRQRVLKSGVISFNGSTIDCVVRNISTTGAALEVESQIGIPRSFDLVVTGGAPQRDCRVLWRKEKRLGIAFGEPAASPLL